MGYTCAAAELDGTIDNPRRRLRHVQLRYRGRELCVDPAIEQLSHVTHERAARLEVDDGVCDQALSEAERVQALAKELPIRRAVHGDVKGAASHPDPTHAVRQACGGEPQLYMLERTAHLAEDRIVPDETVLESDLTMPADHCVVQRGYPTSDHIARGRGRDDEERRRTARTLVVVGSCDADCKSGGVCPCNEPLSTRDTPAAVDPARRRKKGRGVGAGPRLGLGHRKARPNMAFCQRLEPAGALGIRRDPVEQIHVPLVGRGTVQGERPEQAVARLFEHDGLCVVVEPEAAERSIDMRREETRRPRLGLELLTEGRRRLLEARSSLRGNDLLGDELACPSPQFLDLRRERLVDHDTATIAARVIGVT